MMQSGNGIDLAAIHQLLTGVAQRVVSIEKRLDDHTLKLNELTVAANDHSGKLEALALLLNQHGRKIDGLTNGLDELRATVREYHSSVVGHWISLDRVFERVKRIEDHLRLGPIEPNYGRQAGARTRRGLSAHASALQQHPAWI